MTHGASQNPIAVVGAYAVQLLITREALAHEGHGHDSDKDSEETTPSPEAASPTVESESSSAAPSDTNATQEVPIEDALPASASKSGVSDGISMGWEESLLGLIIVGPVLLMSLRNKLQR